MCWHTFKAALGAQQDTTCDIYFGVVPVMSTCNGLGCADTCCLTTLSAQSSLKHCWCTQMSRCLPKRCMQSCMRLPPTMQEMPGGSIHLVNEVWPAESLSELQAMQLLLVVGVQTGHQVPIQSLYVLLPLLHGCHCHEPQQAAIVLHRACCWVCCRCAAQDIC